MADIYLSSVDGDNADDGSTWALAKATLAAALTAAGAGGTVYVDSAHAESTAGNVTLASPGTAAAPVRILCVDRTGNPEPPTALATTATVTTTGNTVLGMTGFAYAYGIAFTACSGGTSSVGRLHVFNSTAAGAWVFDSCTLGMGTTATTAVGQFGNSGSSATQDQLVVLVNTVLSHGADYTTAWSVNCRFLWKDTASALAGAGAPVSLFSCSVNNAAVSGFTRIYGVDLSALGSGQSLVNVAASQSKYFLFQNCKLGSSVSVATGSIPAWGGIIVDLVNCDSADTNYRLHRNTYQGTIDHETTIVRTGGASDGATGISRKLVSSANAQLYTPLVLEGIALWNETVGSALTATVHVVSDNVTFTDKELWLEVEYLGTSGFPVSSFADDRAADDDAHLGSGANQASSTETWTTTGLTTPSYQKLEVTFTPQEKGPIRLRVMLAKPSATVYICPLAEVA